jgi:hypothetical protein
MGSVCLRGFAVVFSLVVGLKVVEASSMVPLPTSVLASQSVWIGRVEIASSQTVQRDVPFEVASAKVLEVFRGRGGPGDKIVFSKPGGRLGQKTFAVVGVPQLNTGKEYIVFLMEDPLFADRSKDIEPQLSNWTAYEVLHDERGAPETVKKAEGAIKSRASQAYSHAMSFSKGSDSYEDFVTQIYRGLD